MIPPPASERRDSGATGSVAPDALKERGAPHSETSITSTAPKEAPVIDITENTESGAQGGLHETVVSNSENNDGISISTRGDSPCKAGSCYLEAHLDDKTVQNASKQVVNSDGTRKRSFQPGNKEAHVSTASSSHRRENSVVETKDARSKFQKKSNNEEPLREEEGKDTGLVGISEELKVSENRPLNSSCLKGKKKQKNGSRGKDNNNRINNTSTSQYLPLPTGTGNSSLTTIVTENNKEAPKCMDLKVKQNPNEATLTNAFVVVNAKSTEGETVNVDGVIQKKYDEVLPSSFEEKETENVVTTFLGSCMLDSNQPASSNDSLTPLQRVRVDANVKTNCLDPATGEYFYQNSNIKTNCLDPTTGEYFYQNANVKTNCVDPTTGEYFYQKANVKTNCVDPTTGEVFYQKAVREDFIKPSDVVSRHYNSEERQNLLSLSHTREAIPHTSFNTAVKENVLPSENPKNQSYPFSEGANFFQIGMVYPNSRAGVHHSMDICGSGAMVDYGFGRSYLDHTGMERNKMQERELNCLSTYHNIHRMRPSNQFSEGANFFQVGMADPNFRAGVHPSMDIYRSGAMADPNYRAGVHHSMDIYGSGAMGYGNFRAGVHHGLDIYRSGAMPEYGFGRSYFDHTSTERNKMQEKELACFSAYHNMNHISPSSLPQAYSENLRVAFSPRQSLVGVRKKKLLILDLNGLLADINEETHNAHMADAKVRGKLVFRRPYCDDFLNFCIRNFELGIWSSRKRKNVDSVVDILMRDLKPYLLFSWDRSKCTITGRKTLENMHKPIVLKELRKLWNKEEPGLPWEEGEFSPSNTLLVDDSPYKALRNPVFAQPFSYASVLFIVLSPYLNIPYLNNPRFHAYVVQPYTAIFPHPFNYLNWNDNSLGPGGDLRVYLENLVFADDVECFVRNHPFGQPFITPSDPHWNFYAEIAGEGYGSVTRRA